VPIAIEPEYVASGGWARVLKRFPRIGKGPEFDAIFAED
jgi:hypothetical protein